MFRTRKALALAASAVLAVGLAGCGEGSSGGGGGGGGDIELNAMPERTDPTQGGELLYLRTSPVEHLDPQRIYTGVDLSNASRMYSRSLLQFPSGTRDVDEANTPITDLATDTGTSNDDATQWSFTLKDGPTWQDGQPVTCEDVKYGVSRTFAQDVITGGPNYIIGYLDIPTAADGSSQYKGPYTGEGQDLFDQAVTCDGNTITYNFNKPWADFPLAIASLRAFDPYREDQDQGDESEFTVFSNGPYMLDGDWNQDTGGTFVRNPEWDPSTDTDNNREANPDTIVFEQGADATTINNRLIDDSGDDQNAVTYTVPEPSQYPRIESQAADRATLVDSPFASYLVPNFNRVTNPKVRQALAMATNRSAWALGLGGGNASTAADSIINPSVPGYEAPSGDLVAPEEGDVDAAKALLEESGESLPYPIKFTFPQRPSYDRAAAALKDTYDAAGFEVELDGLDPTGPYYDTIQKPDSDSDLIWGGWGADWPSISTVLPPLFDSRLNLTEASNGQDYGNYDSDQANDLIDQGLASSDLDEANQTWQELNDFLLQDTAYIPLDVTRFLVLRGSNVENFVQSESTSGYVDLGVISLADGS